MVFKTKYFYAIHCLIRVILREFYQNNQIYISVIAFNPRLLYFEK